MTTQEQKEKMIENAKQYIDNLGRMQFFQMEIQELLADFALQQIERGFDDSETWSLRDTIALFILPRLKRYQEIANDFLKRDDELVNDIDCFIKAMELVSRDSGSCIHKPEEEKQMFEGLEKFPKIFMSLWW